MLRLQQTVNLALLTAHTCLSTPEDAYQGESLRQFSQITICLLLVLKLCFILLHVYFLKRQINFEAEPFAFFFLPKCLPVPF